MAVHRDSAEDYADSHPQRPPDFLFSLGLHRPQSFIDAAPHAGPNQATIKPTIETTHSNFGERETDPADLTPAVDDVASTPESLAIRYQKRRATRREPRENDRPNPIPRADSRLQAFLVYRLGSNGFDDPGANGPTANQSVRMGIERAFWAGGRGRRFVSTP